MTHLFSDRSRWTMFHGMMLIVSAAVLLWASVLVGTYALAVLLTFPPAWKLLGS